MKTGNYQKFIVLSAPRSGSNHLIHFLDNHPNVISYGEPFQPNFLLGNPSKTIFEQPFISLVYRRFRNKYPIFFLKHLIFRQYPQHVSAVGFKIFYEHADQGNLRHVWSFLKDIPGLKIIHLQRKNILKSYTSLLLAFKAGEFISYSGTSPTQHMKITLDYHACKKYFIMVETWRKEYERFFSQKRIMNIYYEDLCRNTAKELYRVQHFLGVVPQRLASPVVKQNTRSLQQIIKNYSELKRQFGKGPWASFFDE